MAREPGRTHWAQIALICASLCVAVLFGWAVLYAFGKFLLEGWS